MWKFPIYSGFFGCYTESFLLVTSYANTLKSVEVIGDRVRLSLLANPLSKAVGINVMNQRKGYLWLVGASVCFLCTGLLLAIVFNTQNVRVSPIQNAYYILVPAGAAALGFLTYIRTLAVAISLAGLTIVIGLVVIEGIKVLPFALPIIIPLIAATSELFAIYELSQSINKKKTFAIVATVCCVSIALGLFSSYVLGLRVPRA